MVPRLMEWCGLPRNVVEFATYDIWLIGRPTPRNEGREKEPIIKLPALIKDIIVKNDNKDGEEKKERLEREMRQQEEMQTEAPSLWRTISSAEKT